MVAGMFTGCSSSNQTVSENLPEKEKAKGKREVNTCIILIEPTHTVEQINEIIGFEGEKGGHSEKYTWKLTDKTSIEVTYSSGSAIIQAIVDKQGVASEKVDFSEVTESKKC